MQIKNIARAILNEYHNMFGKQVVKTGNDIDSETLRSRSASSAMNLIALENTLLSKNSSR